MDFDRLNPQQFARFREFIYQQCGIRVDENKVVLLSNRVRRRVRASACNDFDGYYRLLTSPNPGAELQHFLDAVTTNETSFFRTKKHFDWLGNDWIQEMVTAQRAGQRPKSLRLWSAGCANGAEPYTMAICLAENKYRLRDWTLHVLGTDLNDEVLQAARQGLFAPRAMEDVTERQRQRFFQYRAQLDRWQVRPEIRALVDFEKHNLLHPFPNQTFDCIFIRNVLIYFDRDSKQRAIHHLLKALADGGYLAVGPSEGIYDMLAPLQRISPLLYRKGNVAPSATHPRRQIVDGG